MAEGYQRGGGIDDVSDLDPLFYRGKTPVLGAPVELKTSGTLPGEFAAAGAPPPTAPGAPTAPTRPVFPDFSFEWTGGEFPAPPGMPSRGNVDILGPGGGKPAWWQQAMGSAETVGQGRDALKKLEAVGNGVYTGPLNPGEFSLFGPETGEWWNPGEFSLTGDVKPGLDPSQFNLGMGADKINWPGVAGGALQAAGGLYGAATGTPGSPGQVASSANAVGGLGALGASAGILPASMSALGPAAALVSLPLILGPQVAGMIQGDKARWPTGYQFIPGSSKSGGAGAAAVDPSTGAVIIYKGNGHYEFAEGTRNGMTPTPEDFKRWEITPSGGLAKRAGYTQVGQQVRDVRLSPDRQALAPGSGGATPQDVQSAAEQYRAPAIARLRAQYPTASQAQLWSLYTRSPEYQQELEWLAQFNNSGGGTNDR